MSTATFAKQVTKHDDLVRFKAIGHPAAEGFGQLYNFIDGKYAGRIETVNSYGLSYRAYPASLNTGRLFDVVEDALDYLVTGMSVEINIICDGCSSLLVAASSVGKARREAKRNGTAFRVNKKDLCSKCAELYKHKIATIDAPPAPE